ncbi:hypothetical protein GQ457_01G025640 [Hibiscus cannabinus]
MNEPSGQDDSGSICFYDKEEITSRDTQYFCIDAFIPAKKSKTGFRYGFVRFFSLEDAERAIAHLNGSLLYGSRLNAGLARFSDKLEDRKSKQIKSNVLNNGEASKNISRSVDNQLKPRLKRVLGLVEEEALKKLEKCLISTVETLCSAGQVDDRLQTWGLNNVTIKDLGGSRFIIEVQVDELEHTFHPKQSIVPLQSKDKERVEYSSESSSDSFSGSDLSTAHANGSRINYFEEDETAKAICLGKGSLSNAFSAELNVERALGEKDFLGNLQSEEVLSFNNMENSNPNQFSNEAVCSNLNDYHVEACGPSTQLGRQMVSWADVVAKNLVSQGVKAGEALTQVHNRNLELDPGRGQAGCEGFMELEQFEDEDLKQSLLKHLRLRRLLLKNQKRVSRLSSKNAMD